MITGSFSDLEYFKYHVLLIFIFPTLDTLIVMQLALSSYTWSSFFSLPWETQNEYRFSEFLPIRSL